MHIPRNRVAKSVDDVLPVVCVSSDSVEELWKLHLARNISKATSAIIVFFCTGVQVLNPANNRHENDVTNTLF